MEDVVKLIVENGVSVAVIIYFMYRDNKFMTQLNNTLTTLVQTVDTVKELIKGNESRNG